MKLSIAIGAVILGIVICISGYVSASNYGSGVESELNAARDNSESVLAQYEQKILESVQVPEMYREDFVKVVKTDMEGRYGAAGSSATMQWIKERELNFDSGIYKQLMQTIVSGRKDFETSQTRMIDIRRGYQAQLGYVWRGFWLARAGYPKIDLTKFNPVITSRVETAFATGKESGPLKLR